MPKVSEIASYFSSRIPPEMKMDFDNVGLLVGQGSAEVTKAIVALDITDAVINEAIAEKAQIILSHHPMFFQLKQVSESQLEGRLIIKMLQNGISGFCQHTNLDAVRGGVNDALADRLDITAVGALDGAYRSVNGIEYGMGRYGLLRQPMEFEAFLSHVKEKLGCNGLRYHYAGKKVSRVALCGGSGGEFVPTSAALGCDTLVTADVKYHQFLEAAQLGINLIDADHFCTENVVVSVLAEMLKAGFPKLQVIISASHGQTVQFF